MGCGRRSILDPPTDAAYELDGLGVGDGQGEPEGVGDGLGDGEGLGEGEGEPDGVGVGEGHGGIGRMVSSNLAARAFPVSFQAWRTTW
jgi:hypothetical protein